MATSSASLAQQWGFLLPWCNELQGRIKYELLECENANWEDVKLRLQATLPTRQDVESEDKGENLPQNCPSDNFHVRFQQVREALALLSVVSHVDFEAWRFLLAEHCGVDMKNEGLAALGDKMEATWVLFMDLEGRESEENNAKKELDLVKFCGVEQLERQSEQYLQAMQKIVERAPRCLMGREIQVPVKVDTASCLDIFVSSLPAVFADIQRAEKVVKEQWETYEATQKMKKTEEKTLRCRFVLEPMIADATGCKISAAFAQALKSLVTGNVWTAHTALDTDLMPELENDKRMAKLVLKEVMTSVFDSTRRSPPESVSTTAIATSKSAQLQLGSVHIHCCSLTELDMDALFSAAAVSQTTKKLSIDIDTKEKTDAGGNPLSVQLWKWVAYAFFSRRALSSIETLELTQLPRLTSVEAAAVKTMLASEHPEEALFGTPRGRVIERTATLKANAPIRWKFDERGRACKRSQHVAFESAIPFVRTFSDDGKSDWLNALIPGLGRGLVLRADLMFTEANQPRDRPRGVTALVLRIRLTLPFGDQAPRVLEAVGPSLQYLTLHGASENLTESWVLQQCPNLLKLTIRKGFMNVQFDFSEYRAKNLPLPSVDFDGYNVESLAKKLCNDSHPLTKCIRQLRVRRLNRIDWGTLYYDPRLKRALNLLLQMLEQNKKLEYFQVMLSTTFHDYREKFLEHDLLPTERSQPLPTANKAAFLSVVSARRPNMKKKQVPSSSRMAANQLDQNIVTKIFSLARSPALREVRVFLIHDGIPENMYDDDEEYSSSDYGSL